MPSERRFLFLMFLRREGIPHNAVPMQYTRVDQEAKRSEKEILARDFYFLQERQDRVGKLLPIV